MHQAGKEKGSGQGKGHRESHLLNKVQPCVLWQSRLTVLNGPFTVKLAHCPFIDYCYGECKLVGFKQPIDNREKGAEAGAL